ncbi:MAG: AsmA family protein, partial [Candidatus Binatia bacterium]
MSKRRLTSAAALLLGFFILCYAALYFLVRSDWLRSRLEAEIGERTGYVVRVESLRLTPWLSLVASGLSVSEKGEVVFRGKKIVGALWPWDFFYGKIRRLSLEQPELRLSLQDLFRPSEKAAPNFSIGTLNIADGELVLQTGYEPFVLRSLFLKADNVNLGGETGLQLRTYVPALSGSVTLALSGGSEERRVEIAVVQGEGTGPTRLLPKIAAEKPVLKADFQMRKKDSAGAYEVKGSGSVDQFRWGEEKIDGKFDSLFELDTETGSLQLSVNLKTPRFPTKILPAAFSFDPGAVSAVMRGDYSARRNSLTLEKINVASSLGAIDGNGAIALGEKPAKLNAALRLRGVALDSVKSLLPSPFRGFAYSGKIAADVNLSGAYNALQIATDFQILEGRFSSPEESKAGEHLNVKGRFACRDCNGDASFQGEARVESLELLWNKFFGDFKDHKPFLKVDGSYRREAGELSFDQFRIALGSGSHLDLKGLLRRLPAGPTFDLDVRSDDLRHAALYDFFIRDTFKAAYPLLGQIGLGGKSAVAIRAQGSLESFTAEGKLRIDQGEIRERSGRWRIGPIALELPLRLTYPRALGEKPGGPPPVGRLSIHEIKSPSTVIPKIGGPVILWHNSLRFPEPIRIFLFGGAAVIRDLAWKDIVGDPTNLSFSLELGQLSLVELTEALGWHRFGGTLSGSIPQVHWAADSLRSDGTVTLHVFGGRVTIREMAVERPLSPLRSISMNAKLEGLNLEQASETFEFGRISGILAGAIEDLVITHGQPAQFRADIHTVGTPGVSQWISVEALNKITVLSSGNEAGAIYGGIAGMFDFFRYSKLGFKAALKNDKLTLRGIETKNGQEYLVVGTLLPPTVNIVSHTH